MRNKVMMIEGKTVSYYVYGDESQPAVILLHGLAGSSLFSFFELVQLLKEEFHLILIDQPGHGKSTPFGQEEDYLFSSMAIWYDKVFEKVIGRPFYLAGHSWGADVALHYTRKFGWKIKGLILLDGAITYPHFQEEMTFDISYNGWKEYVEKAEYSQWQDVINEYQLYTTSWNQLKEESLKTIIKNDGKYSLVASEFTILAIIKAFFKEPFYSAYRHIQLPVLLLLAEKPEELESARQRGVAQMRKEICDISVTRINGSGHMLQWDEPEKVASIMREWIMGM
ncbi:alpha/beta hydrolase [Rossellomorea vietnamensis]|uniref:Alpha/beta hydrolase n=1 Tax=Rossellomorea vietnamensis TaxID=218284 RepID=A0A5D4K7E2_9BACI|nr:alpha/beta hydrolase [Rossellomorea vietnamensis]TYR73244.1 alpha/beta hydrolase [Rossellomorea vietnamensis]